MNTGPVITNNILQRVFRIRHNGMTASAYTIEKGDQQYLVSAAHVFDGSPEVTCVNLFHDDHWRDLSVEIAYNSSNKGDTIVFSLPRDISPRTLISYGPDGIALGTWAYFLGFPFELMNPTGDMNNKFPIPLVKAGLISCLDATYHGLLTIFLDGHNNKGFSGGPIVWPNPKKNNRLSIIGTISGYLPESPTATETSEDYQVLKVNAGIVEAHWINELLPELR